MVQNPGARIQIVLADSPPAPRADLRRLIASQPDMEAIGEATDLDEALRQVRRSDADVLILDLAACENGPGLIARLRNECPWTRVLVLTALDTPDHVLAVLAAGAKGYVLGTAPAHDVLKAIRAVSRGSTYVKVTPEMCPPTPA